MFQQYIEGKNPTAFIGGINLVNVRDVAKGLALCGTHGRPGQAYTLGGHNVTYQHLAELLCDAAGQKRPTRMLDPNSLLWVGRLMDWFGALTKIKPKFTRRNLTFLGGRYIYFDTSKVENELGYRIRPIDETIDECVRWFTDERERVLAGEVVHPVAPKRQEPPAAEVSLHAE
jgi:dihydroflavonol-4-reductase